MSNSRDMMRISGASYETSGDRKVVRTGTRKRRNKDMHDPAAAEMSGVSLFERICRHAFEGDVDALRYDMRSVESERYIACEFLNRVCRDGMTPLMHAARGGNPEATTLLVWSGADVNAYRRNGRTALCYASEGGHHECCEKLIYAGAHITLDACIMDRCCKWSLLNHDICTTPLILACGRGHAPCAHVLLKEYALSQGYLPIDEEDSTGFTALTAASEEGHVECLRLLLMAGASVDCFGTANYDIWGVTALMFASRGGHDECVRHLIDARARFDAYDAETGQTAIHMAIRYPRCIQMFVDRKFPLDMRDYSSKTALAQAMDAREFETVRILLSAGASVDGYADSVVTPLAYACSQDDVTLIQFLVQNGENPNAHSKQGERTPLMDCCREGRITCVSALIDVGADVTLRDHNGWTALMHACDVTAVGCLKALVASGRSDVDVASYKHGWTALTIAVRRVTPRRDRCLHSRQLQCVLTLIGKCDPNLPTRSGWTPLMFACRAGCMGVSRLLLEAGARTDPCTHGQRKSAESVIPSKSPASVRLRALLAAHRRKEMSTLMSMR